MEFLRDGVNPANLYIFRCADIVKLCGEAARPGVQGGGQLETMECAESLYDISTSMS